MVQRMHSIHETGFSRKIYNVFKNFKNTKTKHIYLCNIFPLTFLVLGGV